MNDSQKRKKSSAKTEKNTDKTSRWKKGQSGNPSGRPAGSRNKASIAVENLFLDEQERLSRRCIKLAMRGKRSSIKTCSGANLSSQKRFTNSSGFASCQDC